MAAASGGWLCLKRKQESDSNSQLLGAYSSKNELLAWASDLKVC
jgi:hypothetical protein